jgi:hypothetical protein
MQSPLNAEERLKTVAEEGRGRKVVFVRGNY